MKMNLKKIVSVAACLGWFMSFAVPAYGETVFIDGGDPCLLSHILSVYQRGSGVYVTTGREGTGLVCLQAVGAYPPIKVELQMDYPSIASKRIDHIYGSGLDHLGDPVVLYRNGQMPTRYNPALGTGWVDSNALGEIYLREYPWVYHPQLGWLYVREGPIVQWELSFWLLSPDYGWLWKKPSLDLFYHHDSGTFKTISEIVGG